MKTLAIIVVCSLASLTDVGAQIKEETKYKINPTADNKSPTGVYIPQDLDDCFDELKKILHPEFIDEIKDGREDDMIKYHRGLGQWIRNNWGLWSNSQLSKYFNNFEIYHPDDMSSIIITSFWKYLNGKPLELEEQIKYYQDYWEKMRKNKK